MLTVPGVPDKAGMAGMAALQKSLTSGQSNASV